MERKGYILGKKEIENGLIVIADIVSSRQAFNNLSVNSVVENEKPDNKQIIQQTGIPELFKKIIERGLLEKEDADIVWGHENNHVTLAFNIIKKKFSGDDGIIFNGVSLSVLEADKLAIIMSTYEISRKPLSFEGYRFSTKDFLADFSHTLFKQNPSTEKIDFEPLVTNFAVLCSQGTGFILNEQKDIPKIIGEYIATNSK